MNNGKPFIVGILSILSIRFVDAIELFGRPLSTVIQILIGCLTVVYLVKKIRHFNKHSKNNPLHF